MSGIAARITHWGSRMAISVADQGTSSVTHFVLHVFLARLWEPSQYGLFAIMFASLLFMTGVHSALVAEPMSILGPARHGSQLQGYLRSSLRLQAYAALVAMVAAGLAGVIAAPMNLNMAAAMGGLAVATPGFLTFMLLRRACYVMERPPTALLASVVYGGGMLLGLLVLHQDDHVSPVSVLILMGLASGTASLLAGWRLELNSSEGRPGIGAVWYENWQYGRWILAANVAHWGGIGVYLFLIGALVGLAEAGAFRALQTLMGPAQQGLTALGLLCLPWLAARRARAEGSDLDLRMLVSLWGPVVAMTTVYGVLLAVWGTPLTHFVYGREEYTAVAGLLWVFALFMVGTAVAQGLTLSLRSEERSQPVFWSKAAASAVALAFGLAMTWRWGLTGATWGMTISVLAEGGVLMLAFGLRRRR